MKRIQKNYVKKARQQYKGKHYVMKYLPLELGWLAVLSKAKLLEIMRQYFFNKRSGKKMKYGRIVK